MAASTSSHRLAGQAPAAPSSSSSFRLPGPGWAWAGAGALAALGVGAAVFHHTVCKGGKARRLAKEKVAAEAAAAREAGATDSGAAEGHVVHIGTRSSALALWQAHHVADSLRALHPNITFNVLPMNTMGDIDQIKPLSDFASKGVFTKELDVATMNNTIQIAVHCLKDLPTVLPEGLFMAAVLERGDTEDVLVLPASHPKRADGGFEDLPDGAIVGTSAMRRTASVAKYYPKLVCQNIRGNVNTRLAKLDRGDYAALILARVGLERLGLTDRISQVLDAQKYGYAVGQGALAIVCRADDVVTQRLVSSLNHLPTAWACEAERGLLRALNGGCKVPIAIRTTSEPAVMSLDGTVEAQATHTGTVHAGSDAEVQARRIGEELGDLLLSQGADKLLEGIVDRAGAGHLPPSASAQSS